MIEPYIALWFLIVVTGFIDNKNRKLWWLLGAVNGAGLMMHVFVFAANPPVYLGYFALTSFALSVYAMRRKTIFSCMFSTAMALDALAYAIMARAWLLNLPNYSEIAEDFVTLVVAGHLLLLILIALRITGPAVRGTVDAYKNLRRWISG
jgi:hypothetical protein